MSKELMPVDFEGHRVVAFRFQGRWCWIASQVALAIGYSRGSSLANKLTGAWAEELREGRDYDILVGERLRKLMKMDDMVSVSSSAARVAVLYESGLHIALLKTRKPAGRELRRQLANEVMPQLVRDGHYDPEREVTADGELKVKEAKAAADAAALERDIEHREVSLQEKVFELEQKQMQARALDRLVGKLRARGRVDEAPLEVLEIKSAEIESGVPLGHLLPPADEADSWMTPTDIAAHIDVTVQKVGRVITKLGLRGHPKLSRQYLNKAESSARTVVCYRYAPEAVEFIAQELRQAA